MKEPTQEQIKYRNNEQPRQLYCDSLVDFYAKLGNKEFWNNTRKREIGLEAFCQDYLRTNHVGHSEEDAISFQSAINEYRMREEYMKLLS